MEKPTANIPKGIYCHLDRLDDGSYLVCPYWSLKEDLPYQENGYCSYLEQSDWDINEAIGEVDVTECNTNGENKQWKTNAHRSGCCLGMVIPRSSIPSGSIASIIFEKYDKLHRAASSLVAEIQRTNPIASNHNVRLQVLIRELGLEGYSNNAEKLHKEEI